MTKVLILFHSPYGFPHGTAPANRVRDYAKAINYAGGHAKILVLYPTEIEGEVTLNQDASGIYQGVEFVYTSGTTIIPRSKFQRKMLMLKSTWNVFREMAHIRREHSVVIMFGGNWLFRFALFRAVSAIFGIIFIIEFNELPFIFAPPRSWQRKIIAALYQKCFLYLFDGAFVISKALSGYAKKHGGKRLAQLDIPILLDKKEYPDRSVSSCKGRYIGYCGTLSQYKDGVLTLIESFARLSNKYPELSLHIVGKPLAKTDKHQLVETISNSGVSDHIVLHGFLERKKMLEILSNAVLLALAKPLTVQEEYCFPTKLADYFATGTPVVTTCSQSSECSGYLRDGENCYLAGDDSVEAITCAIERALENPTEAERIGREGRKMVLEAFDYRIHGTRIKRFIDLLHISPKLYQEEYEQ